MIKAIIFDLNGVILKSEPLSERVANEYGVDTNFFFGVLKQVLRVARTKGEKPENLWQPVLDCVSASKEAFFEFYFAGESVDEDALSYIKELKSKGFKLFTLSNNFQERTDYYRKHFPEIFESFDKSYFSWETGFVKPDVMAWKNVLEENQLNPAECLYFDDSEENVQVAKSLGIRAYRYESLEQIKSLTSSP